MARKTTTSAEQASSLFGDEVADLTRILVDRIAHLDLEDRIAALNSVRRSLHSVSPFSMEPVDLVQWVPAEQVLANDYNPNTVAPPEMKLLEHSIKEDGYTQPIVTWQDDTGRREVIDGFHRHRVGRECKEVQKRVLGYLPVTTANEHRLDRSDRIAATIRHNRARGKHRVEAMSDIVVELKRRNWNDDKIGRELGMDPDEVLRLCQITGLAEAFADHKFSQAWEADRDATDAEMLSDVIPGYEADDRGRIFHHWDKWECYRHGFYAERPPDGMSQDDGEEAYRAFLADLDRFEASLRVIVAEWTFSCEHYLTNDRMNRIAWLGQASVAHALRIPSGCRGGFNKLTDEQKRAANALALKYLNEWLTRTGRPAVNADEAGGRTEAELY